MVRIILDVLGDRLNGLPAICPLLEHLEILDTILYSKEFLLLMDCLHIRHMESAASSAESSGCLVTIRRCLFDAKEPSGNPPWWNADPAWPMDNDPSSAEITEPETVKVPLLVRRLAYSEFQHFVERLPHEPESSNYALD
jgi:hypothetical protein